MKFITVFVSWSPPLPTHTNSVFLCGMWYATHFQHSAHCCINYIYTHILERFMEVKLTYNKLHIFKIYNLTHLYACETITTIKIKYIFITLSVSSFSFLNPPPSLNPPGSQETIDLSVSLHYRVLGFLEFYINGIWEYELFLFWILLLCIIILYSSCVVEYISIFPFHCWVVFYYIAMPSLLIILKSVYVHILLFPWAFT